MKNLEVDLKDTLPFIKEEELNKFKGLVASQDKLLQDKKGKGNEFLGWYNFPLQINSDLIDKIEETAKELTECSDIIVVIGIGGSYLGAKAVIKSLQGYFKQSSNSNKQTEILFAGHHLSEDYYYELMEYLKNKRYSIIVISKSGTTTEPAIAFRLLRKNLEKKLGLQKAVKHIVAITDANKGALRSLAEQEGYKSFVIDDDIGGRYSVLTPVGLLPIACAGFNVREVLKGAKEMLKLSKSDNFNVNPVYQYAVVRNCLYQKNKIIEILVNYNSKLFYISEWWKQLFGESEGKENKGIFPVSANFTTDLHSFGQYIQEGKRILFETIISVEKTAYDIKIPYDKDDFDKLNYLQGKKIDYINKMAEKGTTLAHVDGGVPNVKISIPEINEFYIGQLIYFFEKSCAISGYLLGVNPFNQPGVEAYKNNMFKLLGKTGF